MSHPGATGLGSMAFATYRTHRTHRMGWAGGRETSPTVRLAPGGMRLELLRLRLP
ncbi:MAG: hypothetical protein R3E12_09960 [Candidatus Eisenbacteria bacterium]